MIKSIIVIDDFYDNPHEIRNYALSQQFDVTGNYPGYRTKPLINKESKTKLTDITQKLWGGIADFPTHVKDVNTYQGSYQWCPSWQKSWVHYDSWNSFACVIYLTPDAPLQCGTALYRHKKTGITHKPENESLCERLLEDGKDYTKWDITARVGNVFNRAVVYPGTAFHASIEYFGSDKDDARLFQTFFFNKK